MNKGCVRPLLYSFGAIVVLTVGLLAWYGPTTALMLGNMMAMSEGSEAAEAMRTPGDVLEYVAAHPEKFSVVAYDTQRPEEGLYYGAETARPVAGLPKLLVLAEYARQVYAGQVDTAQAVPLDSVARYQVPGTGESAHRRAVAALRAEGGLAEGRITLAQAAESMMRWNDNAAADFLIRRLGPDTLRAVPERLGLPGLEPPLPSSGLYLSWSDTELEPEARLDRLRQMPADAYRERVQRLAAALAQDTAYRRRTTERMAQEGSGLGLTQQRAMAALTYPQGTARAYAALMDRLLGDSLFSPQAARLARTEIERTARDTAGTAALVVGSKGESFPGLVSFAGYARADGAAEGRVVVFLAEDLPIAVFYHLMQTGLDRGFEAQLLLDDAFFDEARERLAEP